ncbi:hypothetical protein IJI55_00965 [Candidatus Saccharibacteria bacterium]|nr:hypothetical protein [Candidatus Saccharibacteria bacterium]
MAKTADIIKVVDDEQAITLTNQGELKSVLNNNPPKTWIKPHPFAKNVMYLPVDKVEIMLDAIFQEWRVEVLSICQLAQSICCTVRLHYKNPISGEWTFHDGVGAVPLKTDKGFSAADLSHIKSDAVQTGAPSAKSFAIKDAAEHIGKLFGRDINRKDTADYSNPYEQSKQDNSAAIKLLESSSTLAELKKNFMALRPEQKTAAVIAKKDELKIKLGGK